MKKLYFVGLALILASSVALISYGAYLNESNESQTMQRMKYQTKPLQSAKAMIRNFHPIFVLETVSLKADDVAKFDRPTEHFERLKFTTLLEDAQASRLSIGEHFELYFNGNRSFTSAYVKGIMPDSSQAAAMRKVFFEVDNYDGTLERRTYRNVELVTTIAYEALTVPLSAITDNRQYVFVRTPEKTLDRRKILAGADDGEYIEILSGLREGEVVITSDTSDLEDGMKVSEVEN